MEKYGTGKMTRVEDGGNRRGGENGSANRRYLKLENLMFIPPGYKQPKLLPSEIILN